MENSFQNVDCLGAFPETINRVKAPERPVQIIGWIHFIGLSIITVAIVSGLLFYGRIKIA